jgi:hypothetical protein
MGHLRQNNYRVDTKNNPEGVKAHNLFIRCIHSLWIRSTALGVEVGQAAGIDALLDVPLLAGGQGLIDDPLVFLGGELGGVARVVGVAAPLLHGHGFLGDGGPSCDGSQPRGQ